jgi:O-antigen ligase
MATFRNVEEFVQLSTMGRDSTTATSTQGRIWQFEKGISALMEHPLLGYGVGGGVKLMYPRTSIDNLYLTIVLDTGLTGLFLFILFNYLVFKYSLQNKGIGNKEIYIYISICLILSFFLILSIDTMMSLYYILVAMILHANREVKMIKCKKT